MPTQKPYEIEKIVQENLRCVLAGSQKALPMPHQHQPAGKKQGAVSVLDRAEYSQRKLLHLKEKGSRYEQRFNRPTDETVNKIWDRIKSHLPKDIESSKTGISMPIRKDAGEEERNDLIKAAKQAFVITLDTFVLAGDNNKHVTYNEVFDSLCRAYSDHYHDDKFLAKSARDMSGASSYQCRRDMLVNGVDVNKLWKFVRGWSKNDCDLHHNPLFTWVKETVWDRGKFKSRTTVELRPPEHSEDPKKGTPTHTEILEDFKELLIADSQYPRNQQKHVEIWFADHDTETKFRTPTKFEVCYDLPYNEVLLGDRSKRLLEIQWDTRLLFDVSAFKDDYSSASDRMSECRAKLIRQYDFDPNPHPSDDRTKGLSPKEHRYKRLKQILDANVLDQDEVNENEVRGFLELLDEYDQADRFAKTFGHVNEQVEGKDGFPPIRSAFYRTRNRRYQPEHLWPVYVSNRDEERISEDDPPHESEIEDQETYRQRTPNDVSPPKLEVKGRESYRYRWFKAKDPEGNPCDLKGLDISSSQVQIIAALMGIEELESKSMGRFGRPFKRFLAESVWNQHSSKKDDLSLKTIDKAVSDLREKEKKRKEKGQYEIAARIHLGRSRLRGNYKCANDERLVELVKLLMLRTLYGGNLSRIVYAQEDDPVTYGPGWDYTNAEEFQKYLFS